MSDSIGIKYISHPLSIFSIQILALKAKGHCSLPPTSTHAYTHSIRLWLFAGSGHFQQRSGRKFLPPGASQWQHRISTQRVPWGKSHVVLCTFDSSHQRLCFFLPVNSRNPLRSRGGDPAWGKQCEDGPSHCSSAAWETSGGCYFYFWPRAAQAAEPGFKSYLETWRHKSRLWSQTSARCVLTLVFEALGQGLTCFISLTSNHKGKLKAPS